MNKAQNNDGSPRQDVSWPMLLAVGTVVVGSLWLLHFNVLYTEGEVIQGLFTLIVGLVAACVLIGFWHRGRALWCVTVFGGAILLWQTYQNRKWAVIHEDIVGIVHFAESTRRESGHYPKSLEGYVFKNPSVRGHIYGIGTEQTNGFRINYYMNHPGITYWYSSKTGYGYYPD